MYKCQTESWPITTPELQLSILFFLLSTYLELAESISIAARQFTKKRLKIISVNLNGIPDSLKQKKTPRYH